MPLRLSGLISGLDTDAVVKELMSAQSLKKTKIEQKKTKAEWKQEKWDELNKKIVALYNKQVSKMRLQGSYSKRKVTSSNESAVTATANSNSAMGSHTLQVTQLASSQYVTGAKVSSIIKQNDQGQDIETKVTSSTKLKDMGLTDTDTITVTNKNQTFTIKIGDKDDSTTNTVSTISSLVSKLKSAGLNASFDEKQGRFFISSKESGKDNAFSITGDGLSKLGLTNIGDSSAKPDNAVYVSTDGTYLNADGYAVISKNNSIIQNANISSNAFDLRNKPENAAYIGKDGNYYGVDGNLIDESGAMTLNIVDISGNPDDYLSLENIPDNVPDNVAYISKNGEDYAYYDADGKQINKNGHYIIDNIADTEEYRYVDEDGCLVNEAGERPPIVESNNRISIVEASNAKIILDGAELEDSSNTFSVAGMTLELKNTTTEAVGLNITTDVDATYEDIKSFFKEYNTLLEEINTLYNAGSSRGYEPLSDEEKEAMTDDQIELWEKKIKDSLLRRDSQLGGLADAMRSAMQLSVGIDQNGNIVEGGKDKNPNATYYSLASFGIMTSSDYTERGLLHIYGDSDDDTYAGEDDKLKAALTENPETVSKVMSSIIAQLSETMFDKMKRTSTSSSMTVYNDIELKNQIEDYKDDIKKWENKLKDIENRYYKQFSAMESAMAKMQSQGNYLSGMMGS